MSRKLLITGANGLVGNALIPVLLDKGYRIHTLTRKRVFRAGIDSFLWNVEDGFIEPKAFDGVDAIIHLAGENIASKRWTPQRKKDILNSRVQSSKLLFDHIKQNNLPVHDFIAAGATGIYEDTDIRLFEDGPLGDDFLSETCVLWEKSIRDNTTEHIRIVILRTGVVLSNKGGALVEMMKPVSFFVGAPLGKGTQYLSWIHIEDLVKMYLFALEERSASGVYNAVSPEPVTISNLMRVLGKKMRRPIWPFAVPEFMLRFLLGEMSLILTKSCNVSSRKIEKAGFRFRYEKVNDAIDSLID